MAGLINSIYLFVWGRLAAAWKVYFYLFFTEGSSDACLGCAMELEMFATSREAFFFYLFRMSVASEGTRTPKF